MSRHTDTDLLIRWICGNKCGCERDECRYDIPCQQVQLLESVPSIDIVFCKECKHRPVKEDADGENYGFNLIKPNDGDGRCPCLVSDGWYSWMPRDDFYCGYGERKESK